MKWLCRPHLARGSLFGDPWLRVKICGP